MRTIKFCECRKDFDKIREILDARAKYGCSDDNTTEEAVFVGPNVGGEFVNQEWFVVDNRAHECYLEDFSTLDGALSYATDGHTTAEDDFDRHGEFHCELSERCRWFGEAPDEFKDVGLDSDALAKAIEDTKRGWAEDERDLFDSLKEDRTKRDRFVTSMDEDTDRDELVKGFVDSVLDNVNGVHEVSFQRGKAPSLTKRIEVVFRNEVGSTVNVDGILEKFNMMDWRTIADKICAGILSRCGKDPETHEWPTPRVHVSKVADPDENDIVTSVTLNWSTDDPTWSTLSFCFGKIKAARVAKTQKPKSKEQDERNEQNEQDVVEMCPECDNEVHMRIDADSAGYKAFCPYCGKPLLLCDACTAAVKDDHCDKCSKEVNKEKEESDGDEVKTGKGKWRSRMASVQCNNCEEMSVVSCDTDQEGYSTKCPRCGKEVKVCELCQLDDLHDNGRISCTRNTDGRCFRDGE